MLSTAPLSAEAAADTMVAVADSRVAPPAVPEAEAGAVGACLLMAVATLSAPVPVPGTGCGVGKRIGDTIRTAAIRTTASTIRRGSMGLSK